MNCNYCTDDYETFFGEAPQINPSANMLRKILGIKKSVRGKNPFKDEKYAKSKKNAK